MSSAKNDHKVLMRRMRLAYTLAILTIALAALAGQSLIHIFLDQQVLNSSVVNTAANQRTLTTKLTKEAIALKSARPGSEFTLRRLRLKSAYLQWIQSHRDLQIDHNELSAATGESPAIKALFKEIAKPQDVISSSVRDLIRRAEVADAFRASPPSLNDLERNSVTYIAQMDMIGVKYGEEVYVRSAWVKRTELILIGIVFLVLILEGVFIFRPAIRRLSAMVQDLEVAGVEIKTQQILLQSQNTNLRTEHNLLQETAGNLESANLRFEAAARRFEELFQGLPIACFGYDSTGMIFEWNRACEMMFGLTATDMFMRKVQDLIGHNDSKNRLDEIIASVAQGRAVEHFEWELSGSDVGMRYLLCSTFPVHGQESKVSGGIFSCVDISAQKIYEKQIKEQLDRINEYSEEMTRQKEKLEEANTRLESLAQTDGLTGLRNHRAFQEAFAHEVKRAKRDGTPLALVLLDVDHFKQYNDSFGHPVGDAVLRKVAELLQECARETDLIARYGGEEFVALLPQTSSEGAGMLAERMRLTIQDAKWQRRKVTASFGVAILDVDRESAAELLERVDRALYEAKGRGRNCVHVDTSSEGAYAA